MSTIYVRVESHHTMYLLVSDRMAFVASIKKLKSNELKNVHLHLKYDRNDWAIVNAWSMALDLVFMERPNERIRSQVFTNAEIVFVKIYRKSQHTSIGGSPLDISHTMFIHSERHVPSRMCLKNETREREK